MGRKLMKPDAEAIADLVSDGIHRVTEVDDESFMSNLVAERGVEPKRRVHLAEGETLALARKLNAIAIIDEAPARSIARVYRIKVHGTFYVLALAYKKGTLSKSEVRLALDRMIKEGWRIRTEDYTRILEELNKL